MLPTTFHIPAALLLLVAGLLACFAGYRLFKVVLGVYGFILGALFASSLVSPASTMSMVVAVLVGGLIGALVLTLAYFAGVALLGGGLAVLVVNAFWTQQGWGSPAALPLMVAAVIGAVLGLVFQRYVIIFGTAFGGAWTALVGGLAMAGDPAAQHAADAANVWILYPLHPPTRPWLLAAWVVLAIFGTIVQMRGKR